MYTVTITFMDGSTRQRTYADHRDTADYEMHICIQGDMHEGIENKYRIKTMGVVTHAYEEEME